MSSDLAIEVVGLGKRYRIAKNGPSTHLGSGPVDPASTGHPTDFWALRDISFDVRSGETLGVMGSNGAGKSTLLKILAQITDPSEGLARVRGRVGSLLEVGAGFHQDLTGRDNIALVGTILGMRRKETLAAFDDIVEFSGIEAFIDTPVKRYSSGMYLRLAFSVAAHLETEILLIDEALAVGDQAYREKCVTKLRELAATGRTVLFVSHDAGSISRLCDRAIIIEQGRLVSIGSAEDTLRIYSGKQAKATESYVATELSETKPQIVSVHRKLHASPLPGESTHGAMPTLPIGQPSTLEIEVQLPPDVDPSPLRVLVEIKGSDLWTITGTMFKLRGCEPGRHLLRCHFPSLRVAPGQFTVSVTLADTDRSIETLTQLCPFAVDGVGWSEPTWTWRYVEIAEWEHESLDRDRVVLT